MSAYLKRGAGRGPLATCEKKMYQFFFSLSSQKMIILITIKKRLIADKKFSGARELLTSVGFFCRWRTTFFLSFLWESFTPCMNSSCSEIAKNMQFPSPWLSDISKPLSWAIFSKFSEGSVFPAFPFASISRICRRSSWMAPPVNEKGATIFTVNLKNASVVQVQYK